MEWGLILRWGLGWSPTSPLPKATPAQLPKFSIASICKEEEALALILNSSLLSEPKGPLGLLFCNFLLLGFSWSRGLLWKFWWLLCDFCYENCGFGLILLCVDLGCCALILCVLLLGGLMILDLTIVVGNNNWLLWIYNNWFGMKKEIIKNDK